MSNFIVKNESIRFPEKTFDTITLSIGEGVKPTVKGIVPNVTHRKTISLKSCYRITGPSQSRGDGRRLLCSQNQRPTVVDFAGTSMCRNQAVKKQRFSTVC